jgi:lysophospholipase L1-like esterase
MAIILMVHKPLFTPDSLKNRKCNPKKSNETFAVKGQLVLRKFVISKFYFIWLATCLSVFAGEPQLAPGFQPKPLRPAGGLFVSTPVATPEAVHQNLAIIPAKHNGRRTDEVMQRAKDAPGDYDVEFIGDSITELWEKFGTNVWQEYYGPRKAINMGVGADRTEHVLWRIENGQLDGIKAKVAVVMIGTNNSNKNKDGTDMYSDSDILEGVTAIVKQIRIRQPNTKIILLGIFPRGKAFNPQRGRLLEVNQALAKLDDGKNIFYMDIGSQLVEADGSISKSMIKDYLHPGEAGYKIWAAAIEPLLKKLLANP